MKNFLNEFFFVIFQALAICHNVSPVYEEGVESDLIEADQNHVKPISYQASSPDEIALVKWAENVGIELSQRDLHGMQLRLPDSNPSLDPDTDLTGKIVRYKILQIFPFTSESKRMGIIVKNEISQEITFFMKGADAVMQRIVQHNDWLEEESNNLARQ